MLIAGLVLALFAIGAPAPVTAQGGELTRTECSEDLTGTTIPFYTFGDLSGPFAPITQPLAAALQDALAYYNAQGGVCGAQLQLVQEDTGGNRDQSLAIYQRFSTANPKPLMLLLYASGDAELLRDRVIEDEIPVFLFAGSTIGLYGESADEPGWIYAAIPLYTDQFGAFCRWVSESWTTTLGREGSPRIGHLSWEGPFGRATETPETTAYCESVGVEIVGAEYFLPTATDVTAQINNLVANGANILFTTSLASGSALIARDVAVLGIEEDVILAGVNWALDSSVGLLGQRQFRADGTPSTDGFLGLLPYTWWDEATPGTQLVQEQFAANNRAPALRNIAYLAGFGAVDTFIELLVRTVNRVGADNLTGAAVNETFQTFEYDSLGGVFSYAFTPEIRAQNTTRIGRLTYLRGPDGNFVTIEVGGSPVLVPIVVPVTQTAEEVPDLRPGGADVP
jgi:branched-chain amino acid transport system substrate-binding protein